MQCLRALTLGSNPSFNTYSVLNLDKLLVSELHFLSGKWMR